jgi:uncharacterized membrane protein YhaH (DUF805 family)
MNNIVSLYTSTEGRIGRKTWWLASIGMAVVVVIIEFLILPLVGLSAMPSIAAAQGTADTAALSAALTDATHKSMWVSLVVYILFAWPGIALGLKRRHDRGNNGTDVLVFWAFALVLSLVGALGIGSTMIDAGNGVMIPAPSLPLTIVDGIYGIFGIYLLVVLGFLKGTPGTNQYGPDPLPIGAAVAA